MDQNQTIAKWIWKDGCTGTNITCNFRRTFYLDEAVEEASLQISAHNHVKVYINGHRLSGICSPAASGFPNTKMENISSSSIARPSWPLRKWRQL